MSLMNEIKEKVKQNKKTIILPESMDERVLLAAEKLLEEDIVNIILIGDEKEIIQKHPKLKEVKIINPNDSELLEDFINKLVELRKHKGLTYEEAKDLILNDYMYFSCMLVKEKLADGIVSGAAHSTSNTLRPALQIVKTKPESLLVSSFFLMIVPNSELGENGVFVFSDCALEQNPTPEKLAAIASDSARSFEAFIGKKAKVAFLSHSSHGSAKHADVDKVKEAVNIAKEKYPDILLDGELQLDSAIVPEVAATKVPDSPLKGEANVLIFPDLDAANIGYKLVQRLAKAEAYGPICQGMASPINDLSRGASVEDIIGTVILTSLQAQMEE